MTVVEFMDSIGSGMDAGTSSALLKILQKQGLRFKLGTKVMSATKKAGVYQIETEAAKGGSKETVLLMNGLFCVHTDYM